MCTSAAGAAPPWAVVAVTRVAGAAVTRVAGAHTASRRAGGPRVSNLEPRPEPESGSPESVVRGWIRFGRSSYRALLQRVLRSWAARSLQVGALTTVVDVCVLLVCVRLLHLPTPVGAAAGVAVGATLAFFLNRIFAFRAQGTPVAGQAVRFILSTLIAMAIHATLVGILADRFDVPVVMAKLIADVLVFSIGQLLVMRFLVFRKSPHGAAGQPPS